MFIDHMTPEHFEALQYDSEVLIHLAKIGKQFVEIATKHMSATCAVTTKEETSYPFWIVDDGAGFNTGPFFSRKAAEEYKANRPDFYRVHCCTGVCSDAYQELLDLVAECVGGSPD